MAAIKFFCHSSAAALIIRFGRLLLELDGPGEVLDGCCKAVIRPLIGMHPKLVIILGGSGRVEAGEEE